MNSEDITEIKCAIFDDKHFLINPIELKCGHSIFQNCIPDTYIIVIANENHEYEVSFIKLRFFSKFFH